MKENDILFICDFETTGVDSSLYSQDWPIELGGLFIDMDFKIYDFFNELIYWDYLGNKDWYDEYKPAYDVHNINYQNWIQNAYDRFTIMDILNEKINNLKELDFDRFIILSDNAQFEYNFMRKIFNGYRFPFHYSAWDLNLLFNLNNIERTKHIHRALPDVLDMYSDLIKNFKIENIKD